VTWLVNDVICTEPSRDYLAPKIVGMINEIYSKPCIGHKKTCHLYFWDNFGKDRSISIILSPLQCGERPYTICHSSLNLLLHYLAKFKYSNIHLYSRRIVTALSALLLRVLRVAHTACQWMHRWRVIQCREAFSKINKLIAMTCVKWRQHHLQTRTSILSKIRIFEYSNIRLHHAYGCLAL